MNGANGNPPPSPAKRGTVGMGAHPQGERGGDNTKDNAK